LKRGQPLGHRCAKGFAYEIKIYNRYAEAKGYGVDEDTGLIHSVETIAAPKLSIRFA